MFTLESDTFLRMRCFPVLGQTVLEAEAFRDHDETVRTLLLVAGGGVAGFLMEVSEYILLTHTSSITLSVSGISKVRKSLPTKFMSIHTHQSRFVKVRCKIGLN